MTGRFLPDQRKTIGGYDRVWFDEQEIDALRGKLDVQGELTVHWQWDYVKEVETLRALYERGKTAQWNAETDIDWSVDVPLEGEWLMPADRSALATVLQFRGADDQTRMRAVREELTHGLSQLLHGEQAALQLCAQLVNCVPDMDTKLFAGQQVVDECRHVEVFAKTLSRKFGKIHPIDPNIKYLLDQMLTADQWYKKAVGMQILFEGVAMAIITDIGQRTFNPLVKQVMRYVARDEARHAAFGVLALKEELPRMSAEQRAELEDWTWMCLEVVANGLAMGMLNHVAPKFDLDPENTAHAVLGSPGFEDARYHMFNHTVLPNLKKLGLITERTRADYEGFKLLGAQAPNGSPRRGDTESFLSGA